MRSTVRSVAGAPGSGRFCVNLSIIAARVQTGSDGSPSMVGASRPSIRMAVTLGRTNPDMSGWAEANELIVTKPATAANRNALDILYLGWLAEMRIACLGSLSN